MSDGYKRKVHKQDKSGDAACKPNRGVYGGPFLDPDWQNVTCRRCLEIKIKEDEWARFTALKRSMGVNVEPEQDPVLPH